MALHGLKVLELAGLAPAPFCGMLLSDYGASVTRIDRFPEGNNMDTLSRGKRSVAINLAKKEGQSLLIKMAKTADVLIEPYRKGIMEKLGLGPDILTRENPRLIYARLTGYGQNGLLSNRAGHDINYLAISGVLSFLGRANDKPTPPINLLADFAGGGLMCAFGILMALFEREKSNLGQVIDSAMVDQAAYLGKNKVNELMPILAAKNMSMIWKKPYKRGENLLDTGAHFYDTYETKDGKYMAVGAIEPQFYEKLLKGLNITEEEAPYLTNFKESKKLFETLFKQKTQDEWNKIFENVDACVTPVLDQEQFPVYQHNRDRDLFWKTVDGDYEPKPAPKLSRTPSESIRKPRPEIGQNTDEVLREYGLTNKEIDELRKMNIINPKFKGKL